MGEERISEEMRAMLWDTTHPHTVATFLVEVCGSGGVPLDFPAKQRLIERIQWMEQNYAITTNGNGSLIISTQRLC